MGEYTEKLARACGLTLITEMDPVLYARGKPRDEAFREAGIDPEESYDLLSVPSFAELLADANRIHELVENVKLALSIHRPETVAVLHAHEGSSCRKCRQAGEITCILENYKLPAKVTNIFAKRDTARSEVPYRVNITCMDFRLHSTGRLALLIDEEYGMMSNAWITYPGAAIVGRNVSSFVRMLEDLQRLHSQPMQICVISHTDCAKYKSAFKLKADGPSWEEIEPQLLRRDLDFVKEALSRFFARPEILVGTAVLRYRQNQSLETASLPRF